jgi:hypothetical protein
MRERSDSPLHVRCTRLGERRQRQKSGHLTIRIGAIAFRPFSVFRFPGIAR